jgi:signal transduction histidine kinase
MEADHGTIALVDTAEGVIRIEATHEMPHNELGAEFRKGEGLVGEVWRCRRSVILGRYAELSKPHREMYSRHTVIGVPIRWGREVIGVFGVGRSKERDDRGVPQFGPRDTRRLETFARYASLTIHIARTAQNERQRAARLALISRVGRLITADLRVDELLQTAADALHEILGYPNIAIPLLDRGPPEVLVVGTVGGHYKNVVRGEYRLTLTTGIMGAAARARRIILVNDVTRDPRYFPTPNSKGIYAELAVPIMLGDECLGVLNVESGKSLSNEDAEYLQIIADQLAVAIENARLHATARELAVVDERHRLARELHDSVTQLIFSATLIAESLAPVWRRDPEEGERRAQRLLELSRLALGEMRALLTELRSAEAATFRLRPQHDATRELEPLREHGLREAIRRHARAALGDSCRIVVSRDRFRPMPAAQENAMYRIAQEALFNVAKHARAESVSIKVSSTKKQATLRIADDGTGIRPTKRKADSGHGLVFMRERAEQLGGRFTISARRTRGTIIEVVLPLDRRRQG